MFESGVAVVVVSVAAVEEGMGEGLSPRRAICLRVGWDGYISDVMASLDRIGIGYLDEEEDRIEQWL